MRVAAFFFALVVGAVGILAFSPGLAVHIPDTDLDGYQDPDELAKGSLPLVAASTPEHCDGIDNDGDTVFDEAPAGAARPPLDPLCGPLADADGDTILNGVETDDDNDSLGSMAVFPLGNPCGPPLAQPQPIFSDCVEQFLSSDELDSCTDAAGAHDADPLDNNKSGARNVSDILAYKGHMPVGGPGPGYSRRLDLDVNSVLGVGDVLLFKHRTPHASPAC